MGRKADFTVDLFHFSFLISRRFLAFQQCGIFIRNIRTHVVFSHCNRFYWINIILFLAFKLTHEPRTPHPRPPLPKRFNAIVGSQSDSPVLRIVWKTAGFITNQAGGNLWIKLWVRWSWAPTKLSTQWPSSLLYCSVCGKFIGGNNVFGLDYRLRWKMRFTWFWPEVIGMFREQ